MPIKYKKYLYGILIFFVIFAFPVIPFFSSAKIVMLYVIMMIILTTSFKANVKQFRESLSNFLEIYYLVFFFTITITVIWTSFDWSLTSRVFSSFLLYFVSFCLYQFARPYVNIEKVIVYCFVIQSIFIILSIFSESFFSLMEPFRKVDEARISSFGRLRGNAISGYQFFGISTMYSFVIIFLILHLEKFKYSFLFLLLLCIAGVCSGRTSVVGIIIGIPILIWKNVIFGNLKKVIWICLSLIFMVSSLVFLLYQYVDEITDPLMYEVVSEYLIDPIDSILEDNSFESSSTNELLYMYGKDDIKQYFVWGSGRYELENGGYFGGVDIGYYRMLGYYGIIGFILITYALYYLIYRTRSNLDIYTKHAFFINFLVLNLKGDVQVFNNNIIPIIVAFLFFYTPESQKGDTDITHI